MIVQFSDKTETKISSILCAYQEGWDYMGEVTSDDPRYKEFTKKMTLLVEPDTED